MRLIVYPFFVQNNKYYYYLFFSNIVSIKCVLLYYINKIICGLEMMICVMTLVQPLIIIKYK